MGWARFEASDAREWKPGHDAGFVTKGLALFGDGPDVDVLLDGVPAEGGVLGSCLAKQAIVFKTVLWWVVSKERDQQSLVLGHFQSGDRKVYRTGGSKGSDSRLQARWRGLS